MTALLVRAAALVLFALPAFAQDVPALIEERLLEAEREGAIISFSNRDVSGGAVTYRDLVITAPEDEARLTIPVFRAAPAAEEGQIALTFPPLMTLRAGETDAADAYTVEISSAGLSLTGNFVGKNTDSPTGVVSAESLRFQGVTDGHPFIDQLDVALAGLAIAFERNSGDGTGSMTSDLASLAFAYILRPVGPPGETQIADWSLTEVDIDTAVAGYTGGSFPAFVDGGGSFDVTVSIAGSSGTGEVRSPALSYNIAGTTGPGVTQAALQDGVVRFFQEGSGVSYDTVELGGPRFTLPPFSAAMESYVMTMAAPLTETDAPTEAAFRFELNGLSASDSLWDAFDPTGNFPRDPATLQIDLTSRMALKQSLNAMVARRGPMPPPTELATIDDLSIRRVVLNAGGLALDAAGALSFDNAGPVPMPTGAVDVALSGVQGFADKLVALGVIPQQQAMMGMGMLMAFAAPGDAPDSFTSRIEIDQGQITANGTPLPF